MNKNTGPIISEEIQLIEVMIKTYYHKTENSAPISEKRMLSYAKKRLEYCRFGESKTTCQRCPIHCYQENYREQMKKIMRFSGPKMILKHPILTVKHGLRGMIHHR
ncbi:nitrous oxide-stimulated promoter family protein [Vagococcus intermedius]|uniref:Nitrous oxide-stimulated promoter family protein n=1 Tax=Vagococcus intermedius TaxID=2991418 RepID=A0AAF0I660_9ENTE|nr:nitrous oxide-stimulated promoter family protein [Vagococcus intermedius]WEG72495.1 nitrous oxide-stimulated promoter family protein [Vagococcus intermedius]WEG74582.1 nitrous oxide-stimulated promoter family protein [Vagococcus intermedius]